MKTIIIRRVASNKDGTFGTIIDVRTNGMEVPFALTVEPEDKNNQPNISCIPPGEYEAVLRKAVTSKRDYDVWQLEGVPGRFAVQVHKGTTEDSSLGCPVVGERFEPYKGKSTAVMFSTDAYNELMRLTKGHERIKFKIEKCYKNIT